jgi:hypothetical protein
MPSKKTRGKRLPAPPCSLSVARLNHRRIAFTLGRRSGIKDNDRTLKLINASIVANKFFSRWFVSRKSSR